VSGISPCRLGLRPRNPTIPVFEARSIGIEEHLHTLSKLSIDSLGFDRLWLIRSIFGAMVLGSIAYGTLRERLPTIIPYDIIILASSNQSIDAVSFMWIT
jgi:hypothetical protein